MIEPRRPGTTRRTILPLLLLIATGLLVALGVWQVQRRLWKHELIAAVDARVAAPAVLVPGPDEWPALNADKYAYRHVRVTGRFLAGRDTLVRAVSDLGSGYWVMSPVDTGAFTLLVNRGFVPQDKAKSVAPPPSGQLMVRGLLRMSEPGGGFLRANDVAANRWYSRDVSAISAARGLSHTAPYFVDADAAMNAPGAPVGGLTVIRFPDNHMTYALTWFALAAMSGWGAWRVRRTGGDESAAETA